MLELADSGASQGLYRLHLRLIGGQPQRDIELGHVPQGECLGLGGCLRQLEAQPLCAQIRALHLQCLQPVVDFFSGAGRAVDRQGLCLIEQLQEVVLNAGRFHLCPQFEHGTVIEARTFQRLLQHIESVAQAAKAASIEQGRVNQSQQPRPQGEQQARQVAAVDGGYVPRCQRLQCLGVVPVVEVPLMPLKAGHGFKGGVDAFKQAPAAQIAEIVGRQVREQGHAHVGR
ncbi:hypothetical protein D3C76_605920 [compost metagenome]